MSSGATTTGGNAGIDSFRDSLYKAPERGGSDKPVVAGAAAAGSDPLAEARAAAFGPRTDAGSGAPVRMAALHDPRIATDARPGGVVAPERQGLHAPVRGAERPHSPPIKDDLGRTIQDRADGSRTVTHTDGLTLHMQPVREDGRIKRDPKTNEIVREPSAVSFGGDTKLPLTRNNDGSYSYTEHGRIGANGKPEAGSTRGTLYADGSRTEERLDASGRTLSTASRDVNGRLTDVSRQNGSSIFSAEYDRTGIRTLTSGNHQYTRSENGQWQHREQQADGSWKEKEFNGRIQADASGRQVSIHDYDAKVQTTFRDDGSTVQRDTRTQTLAAEVTRNAAGELTQARIGHEVWAPDTTKPHGWVSDNSNTRALMQSRQQTVHDISHDPKTGEINITTQTGDRRERNVHTHRADGTSEVRTIARGQDGTYTPNDGTDRIVQLDKNRRVSMIQNAVGPDGRTQDIRFGRRQADGTVQSVSFGRHEPAREGEPARFTAERTIKVDGTTGRSNGWNQTAYKNVHLDNEFNLHMTPIARLERVAHTPGDQQRTRQNAPAARTAHDTDVRPARVESYTAQATRPDQVRPRIETSSGAPRQARQFDEPIRNVLAPTVTPKYRPEHAAADPDSRVAQLRRPTDVRSTIPVAATIRPPVQEPVRGLVHKPEADPRALVHKAGYTPGLEETANRRPATRELPKVATLPEGGDPPARRGAVPVTRVGNPLIGGSEHQVISGPTTVRHDGTVTTERGGTPRSIQRASRDVVPGDEHGGNQLVRAAAMKLPADFKLTGSEQIAALHPRTTRDGATPVRYAALHDGTRMTDALPTVPAARTGGPQRELAPHAATARREEAGLRRDETAPRRDDAPRPILAAYSAPETARQQHPYVQLASLQTRGMFRNAGEGTFHAAPVGGENTRRGLAAPVGGENTRRGFPTGEVGGITHPVSLARTLREPGGAPAQPHEFKPAEISRGLRPEPGANPYLIHASFGGYTGGSFTARHENGGPRPATEGRLRGGTLGGSEGGLRGPAKGEPGHTFGRSFETGSVHVKGSFDSRPPMRAGVDTHAPVYGKPTIGAPVRTEGGTLPHVIKAGYEPTRERPGVPGIIKASYGGPGGFDTPRGFRTGPGLDTPRGAKTGGPEKLGGSPVHVGGGLDRPSFSRGPDKVVTGAGGFERPGAPKFERTSHSVTPGSERAVVRGPEKGPFGGMVQNVNWTGGSPFRGKETGASVRTGIDHPKFGTVSVSGDHTRGGVISVADKTFARGVTGGFDHGQPRGLNGGVDRVARPGTIDHVAQLKGWNGPSSIERGMKQHNADGVVRGDSRVFTGATRAGEHSGITLARFDASAATHSGRYGRTVSGDANAAQALRAGGLTVSRLDGAARAHEPGALHSGRHNVSLASFSPADRQAIRTNDVHGAQRGNWRTEHADPNASRSLHHNEARTARLAQQGNGTWNGTTVSTTNVQRSGEFGRHQHRDSEFARRAQETRATNVNFDSSRRVSGGVHVTSLHAQENQSGNQRLVSAHNSARHAEQQVVARGLNAVHHQSDATTKARPSSVHSAEFKAQANQEQRIRKQASETSAHLSSKAVTALKQQEHKVTELKTKEVAKRGEEDHVRSQHVKASAVAAHDKQQQQHLEQIKSNIKQHNQADTRALSHVATMSNAGKSAAKESARENSRIEQTQEKEPEAHTISRELAAHASVSAPAPVAPRSGGHSAPSTPGSHNASSSKGNVGDSKGIQNQQVNMSSMQVSQSKHNDPSMRLSHAAHQAAQQNASAQSHGTGNGGHNDATRQQTHGTQAQQTHASNTTATNQSPSHGTTDPKQHSESTAKHTGVVRHAPSEPVRHSGSPAQPGHSTGTAHNQPGRRVANPYETNTPGRNSDPRQTESAEPGRRDPIDASSEPVRHGGVQNPYETNTPGRNGDVHQVTDRGPATPGDSRHTQSSEQDLIDRFTPGHNGAPANPYLTDHPGRNGEPTAPVDQHRNQISDQDLIDRFTPGHNGAPANPYLTDHPGRNGEPTAPVDQHHNQISDQDLIDRFTPGHNGAPNPYQTDHPGRNGEPTGPVDPRHDGHVPGQDGLPIGQDGRLPVVDGHLPGQDSHLPGQDGHLLGQDDRHQFNQFPHQPGDEDRTAQLFDPHLIDPHHQLDPMSQLELARQERILSQELAHQLDQGHFDLNLKFNNETERLPEFKQTLEVAEQIKQALEDSRAAVVNAFFANLMNAVAPENQFDHFSIRMANGGESALSGIIGATTGDATFFDGPVAHKAHDVIADLLQPVQYIAGNSDTPFSNVAAEIAQGLESGFNPAGRAAQLQTEIVTPDSPQNAHVYGPVAYEIENTNVFQQQQQFDSYPSSQQFVDNMINVRTDSDSLISDIRHDENQQINNGALPQDPNQYLDPWANQNALTNLDPWANQNQLTNPDPWANQNPFTNPDPWQTTPDPNPWHSVETAIQQITEEGPDRMVGTPHAVETEKVKDIEQITDTMLTSNPAEAATKDDVAAAKADRVIHDQQQQQQQQHTQKQQQQQQQQQDDLIRADNYQAKYTVKPNDSLESIASTKLGTKDFWSLIYELNKHKIPVKIVLGKKLFVLTAGMILLLPSKRQQREWRKRKLSQAAYAQQAQVSSRLMDVDEEQLAANKNRRSNVEKLLGSFTKAPQAPSYVVRLNDTLTTIATKHPALNDASLWKLLAAKNNLPTPNASAKLQRGTKLLLPTAQEIAEFRKASAVKQGPKTAPLTVAEPVGKECPDCHRLTTLRTPVCPACGHSFEGPQTSIEGTINTDAQFGTRLDDRTVVSVQLPQDEPVSPNAPTRSLNEQSANTTNAGHSEIVAAKHVSANEETVIERSIEELSNICKLTTSTIERGEVTLYRSQLEVKRDDRWHIILFYELSNDASMRQEILPTGSMLNMKIDLPLSLAQDMVRNDLSSNWLSYSKKFLAGKRLSA